MLFSRKADIGQFYFWVAKVGKRGTSKLYSFLHFYRMKNYGITCHNWKNIICQLYLWQTAA